MKDFFKYTFAGVVGAAFVVGLQQSLPHKEQINQKSVVQSTVQPSVQQVSYLPVMEGDFVSASEIATQAVVHITAKKRGQAYHYGNQIPAPLREFFGFPEMDEEEAGKLRDAGSGSGVLISEDGLIVTNNHVIDQADEIEVSLNNNKTYTAELLGTDPNTDLAVLKIQDIALPFLKLANSDQVRVGEWVLAVGNPFNLTSTVTSGIVSAKARDIHILQKTQNRIESFIQTDAAINPGNSGGALVNTQGELVGINTAIASNTGSYAGYGFAIPSNLVDKVIKDILEYGIVQRAFIGVQIRDIDPEVMEEFQLSQSKGVFVADLMENGAAEEAGIRKGDIILSVDELEVSSSSELMEKIGRKRPGDSVILTILRGNTVIEKAVVLKNKKGGTALISKSEMGLSARLGVSLKEVEEGVQVSQLQTGLVQQQTKMREGFIITAIDGKSVDTTEDVSNILKGKRGGVLLEGFYPGSSTKYYYGIGLEE